MSNSRKVLFHPNEETTPPREEPYYSSKNKTPHKTSDNRRRAGKSFYPDTPSHDRNREYGEYDANDVGNGVTEDPLNHSVDSWYQTETKSALLGFNTPRARSQTKDALNSSLESKQDFYEDGVPSPSSSVVRIWIGGNSPAKPPTETEAAGEGGKGGGGSIKGNRRRSVSNGSSAPRSRSSTLHSDNLRTFYNLEEETSPEMQYERAHFQGRPENPPGSPIHYSNEPPGSPTCYSNVPGSGVKQTAKQSPRRFERYLDGSGKSITGKSITSAGGPLVFMTTPTRPTLFDPRSPGPGCKPRLDAAHLNSLIGSNEVHSNFHSSTPALSPHNDHHQPIPFDSSRSPISHHSVSSSIPMPNSRNGTKRAVPGKAVKTTKKKVVAKVSSFRGKPTTTAPPPSSPMTLSTSSVLNRMALENLEKKKSKKRPQNKVTRFDEPTVSVLQPALSTSQIVTRMALENLAKKKKPKTGKEKKRSATTTSTAAYTKKSAGNGPRTRTGTSGPQQSERKVSAPEKRAFLAKGGGKRTGIPGRNIRKENRNDDVTPTKDDDGARDPKSIKKMLGYVPRTLKWRVDYGAVKSKINSGRQAERIPPPRKKLFNAPNVTSKYEQQFPVRTYEQVEYSEENYEDEGMRGSSLI